MSSGERHSGATIGISIGLAIGSLSSMSGLGAIDIMFITIGCLFGLLLSPDADIDTGSIADAYIKKIFGRPGLWIYSLIWEPYKIGIKHRSFWSHTPIIGTIVRLLYCVLPLIIVLLKDQNSTPILVLIPKAIVAQITVVPFIVTLVAIINYANPNLADVGVIAMSMFVGLCVADFGHWVLDI